jgi:hypothetical protein
MNVQERFKNALRSTWHFELWCMFAVVKERYSTISYLPFNEIDSALAWAEMEENAGSSNRRRKKRSILFSLYFAAHLQSIL